MAPITKPPIPVTLITGFLGSGKTTLILNLIPQLRANNPNYRVALLKNELGDLAIDSQLAETGAISGVRELLDGCICCDVVGQLGPALEELCDKVNPDRIIIETNGSQNPGRLVIDIKQYAQHSGRCYLDGVVNVIDVENWQGYGADVGPAGKAKAELVDLLVLSKWESAGDDLEERCRDRLGDIDVEKAIVRSNKGWISKDVLFGADGRISRALTEGEDDNDVKDHPEHVHIEHVHQHGHEAEVGILSIELKGEPNSCVSMGKLEKLMEKAPKDEVYRIKAVLTLSSPPMNSEDPVTSKREVVQESPHRRYILNWAFTKWTFTPIMSSGTEHASSTDSTLRMTIITVKGLTGKSWRAKMERNGKFELNLEGDAQGELIVKKLL